MKAPSFVAHVIDPFGVEAPALCILRPGLEPTRQSLPELSVDTDPIVTFETHLLITALRKHGLSVPKLLVDVRDGLKLSVGLSKDQGGEKRWDAFKSLSMAHPGTYAKVLANMMRGRTYQATEPEMTTLLEEATRGLATLWAGLELSLRFANEWSRFLDVEIPVQQVFWQRERNGIAINKPELERLSAAVRQEKYLSYRELAQQLGESPSSLNFSNVADHLKGTDAEFLSAFSTTRSLESCFEVAQEQSSFARHFLSFVQARKDEATLIRVGLNKTRVFPQFECFGTVTGRIIITDPALQGLRRRHRGIIAADEGMELLYFDYAQFEPGILASISEDAALISDYNSHDLYSQLSHVLFASHARRSEAKRVFLAHLYGMPSSSIALLLAGSAKEEEREQFHEAVENFFNKYPGLERARQSALDELQQQGRVSSIFGNHRRRTHSGRLSKREQQWALSQKVQGTASLIFKEAVQSIALEAGSGCILLPMHDALLLQSTPSAATGLKERATSLMEDAFVRRCPGVRPRVISEPFALTHHQQANRF